MVNAHSFHHHASVLVDQLHYQKFDLKRYIEGGVIFPVLSFIALNSAEYKTIRKEFKHV